MEARTDRRGVPSLVLLPGFMQRGDAWGAVAERLGARYPSTPLDFTSHSFRGRLAEIEAAAGEGAVLVGYSLGGRLALHAALRAPHRYAALVLVGASAGIEAGGERRARRMADESLAAWIERHAIEAVVERWERRPVFASQPPEVVAAQRRGRLSHEPAQLAALLRSAGQGATAPVWERLAELALPVLALTGALDEPYTAAAARMAAALPRGAARSIEGAGHAPQLERPARVADALLEFLDEHFGERGVVDRDA